MPMFRLTYLSIDKDTITVKFEMSQDGHTFKVYTEGTCRRKKQASRGRRARSRAPFENGRAIVAASSPSTMSISWW
jgi:hypothetical protein